MRNREIETSVRGFYEIEGWSSSEAGVSHDAELWEDLRPCATEYVSACRRKLLDHLPPSGELFLDAGSGPIQYPEYLEYSAGYRKRVCVDISESALALARQKLGDRGEYVCASILELPFPDDHFDAVASLHTIYHVEHEQQDAAVRQLIRVAKPGTKVVIVYSNPDSGIARASRALTRIKRLARRARPSRPARGTFDANHKPLYFFAHPLDWWHRFSDEARVELYPWRSLTAGDSKRLIPDNAFGRLLFKELLRFEALAPATATRLDAYPMIVLTKR